LHHGAYAYTYREQQLHADIQFFKDYNGLSKHIKDFHCQPHNVAKHSSIQNIYWEFIAHALSATLAHTHRKSESFPLGGGLSLRPGHDHCQRQRPPLQNGHSIWHGIMDDASITLRNTQRN
jgi:hypothetical protein